MEKKAVTGLLVLCLLLAAGLALIAVLNFRAARRAARDVLYSRASQTHRSFVASARLTGALSSRKRLQELAEEMSADGMGVLVMNHAGEVLAAARDGRRQKMKELSLPTTTTIVRGLSVQGEFQRLVRGEDGTYLELWQPMGRGRRMRGRFGRPGPWPGEVGKSGSSGWSRSRPGSRERGGRRRLVRVAVPLSWADPVVVPARNTMILAGAASLALTLLGFLLYRGARRARVAERELQHQRALSVLGEMAAIMAHEIRTPLAAVKGNAQLLAEAAEGGRDEGMADSIVREASRLERLVNGLLDYARPSELSRTRCDANELATRAAQIVAPGAMKAGVNLITDPATEEEAILEADPDKVLQVLVNLLQNAVEAASDPAATGTAVTMGVRSRGDKILFSVLDQGPGLGDTDPEELFRPFFSSKKQGTGLGLSIAHRIVQQHGGTLELADRPEGGTAARVLI